ncbi:Enamine deaminase RidA, house cleaning of reactive enamine intermediates, YjgF/YER057c/UK114 family [Amphibacillus marinus]|uniref:Enamine deaminase RidA, house cleaning of reactive enamine intermediates, YjgF/YER057c/UK114 family n=1 Tax=Amphibacillus marinus TaxID=872970 RepID=A0A1H8M673_9BACI|nr:RidA family protein [Amphibacillus marinus]SEO12863.1 Enamine deaminase RidA, house cleaning of reactive enamine intermediates, YjgF/YER057c/UK114 family [Amphibacillus marinus]
MRIEARLAELGLQLPEAAPPGASYLPVKQTGKLLYVSGQIPMLNGTPLYVGKVGGHRDLSYAQEAARLCIFNLLAAVKAHIGSLDGVVEFIKIHGFVNSDVGFDQQHIVINAASDLLFDIFGEAGRHARTAIGTNQLPLDVTVEIDAIIEVTKEGSCEI